MEISKLYKSGPFVLPESQFTHTAHAKACYSGMFAFQKKNIFFIEKHLLGDNCLSFSKYIKFLRFHFQKLSVKHLNLYDGPEFIIFKSNILGQKLVDLVLTRPDQANVNLKYLLIKISKDT